MCPSKTYCTTMVEIKHRPVHKKLTLYHQAVSPAVIFRYCAQLHFKIKIKPIKVGRTPRKFWWFWDVSNVPLMASEGSSGWMDITANSRQMFAPVGGRMGHQNEVCKELQEKLLVGIWIEEGSRKKGDQERRDTGSLEWEWAVPSWQPLRTLTPLIESHQELDSTTKANDPWQEVFILWASSKSSVDTTAAVWETDLK